MQSLYNICHNESPYDTVFGSFIITFFLIVRQSDARWCERSANQLMVSLLLDMQINAVSGSIQRRIRNIETKI